MFATFKMLVVYGSLGLIVGVVGIPHTLLVGDITRLFNAAMRIVKLGLRAAGIRVVTSGLENVPADGRCIYMCNHVSNLDPPVLMPQLPHRFAVLLKKELMSIPILGTAMRLAKFVPVERGSRRDAAQAAVKAAAAALEAGLSIVVFPEGTRSADGRLRTFKKGPFFLAEQTGAPILPVALSGTQEMLPKGKIGIVPGTAVLKILPAIWPQHYANRESLMQAVYQAIASALPDEMKPLPTSN